MSDLSNNSVLAAATGEIVVKHDKNHDLKDMKFGFRKVTDTDTGVETRRATVEVKLPVVSFEGIVAILQDGGKGLELLTQAVESVYSDYIKSLLAEDATITSENFPFDKVSWDAIANQPDAERRGRGIAKELWEDFFKDYIVTMPGLTGKTEKQVEKQAAVLAQKLNPLKNHEDKANLLPKFKDQLTVYLNGSKQAETFSECIDFLMKKADTLLNAEAESNLAANLGF